MRHRSTRAEFAFSLIASTEDTDTDVDLELRYASGNVLATRILTIPAGQLIQLPLSGASGLFNRITNDLPNASAYFLSGAPIFVYGSVVDNTSAPTATSSSPRT